MELFSEGSSGITQDMDFPSWCKNKKSSMKENDPSFTKEEDSFPAELAALAGVVGELSLPPSVVSELCCFRNAPPHWWDVGSPPEGVGRPTTTKAATSVATTDVAARADFISALFGFQHHCQQIPRTSHCCIAKGEVSCSMMQGFLVCHLLIIFVCDRISASFILLFS